MRLIRRNREKLQFNHNLLMDDLFLDVEIFSRLLMFFFSLSFLKYFLYFILFKKKNNKCVPL